MSTPLPPDLSAFSLWEHQREAIDMARRYLGAFRAGRTQGSALVHLPTGAGKSGVIAILARTLPSIRSVLVLTPRIALRDQLANDINGRFFSRLARSPNSATLPKRVVRLDGPPPQSARKQPDEVVFVSTIQLYYGWHKRNSDIATLLQKHTDLVLVDEGHYEPAPNWQEAIRSLKCPKVLFTATPYRNDLKVFDIDFDHAYSLCHQAALDGKFVRELKVCPRVGHDNNPVRFVEDILQFYDTTFPDAGGLPAEQQPRAILRCDAHDRIRQIAEALRARGRSVVAVHDQFRNDPARPHERRRVPDPTTEPAVFWVHQFKLLEGLDDERFQIVAAYDPFGNARELVQQVGRALRNPRRLADQQAYLLDHSLGRLQRLWAGYLAYDSHLRVAGTKSVLEPGQQLFDAWLKGVRQTVYLAGSFRSPLQLSSFDPEQGLQLPRTVNVYRKSESFQLPRVKWAIGELCREEDLVHQVWQPSPDTLVALYVVLDSSPLLRDDFFMDSQLAAVVVRETPEYVFVLDTAGLLRSRLPDLGYPVKARDLRKLFPQARSGRITHVSVRNSNLAPDAIRARTLSARSLKDTIPAPDDRNSVCSTLEGYAPLPEQGGPVVRRYLGFGRGKVSDYGGGYVTLADYRGWLDGLAKAFRSKARPLQELSRYALEVNPPRDCTPTSCSTSVRPSTATSPRTTLRPRTTGRCR